MSAFHRLGLVLSLLVPAMAACQPAGSRTEKEGDAPPGESRIEKEGDAPPPAPGGPILDYVIGGGIVGHSEHLQIYPGGELHLGTANRPVVPGPTVRGSPALDRVLYLAGARKGFFRSWEDGPGVFDGMGVDVTLFGSGTESMTIKERREIEGLAGGLVRLAMGLELPESVRTLGGTPREYLPRSVPDESPDLLFSYRERPPAPPVTPTRYRCARVDVYEGGRLRCQDTCGSFQNEIVVTGSTAYDRVKQLAENARTSGVHAMIDTSSGPPYSTDVDLHLFGRGKGALDNADWEDLRRLATNLEKAICPAW